jgi:hypothetical protein
LECYSPTSSQARVLVVQASVAAYLTRFAAKFFSYDSLNARKRRNSYQQATYKDTLSHVLNQEFLFFGSRVVGFASNPSRLKYWLLSFSNAGDIMLMSSSQNKGIPVTYRTPPTKDLVKSQTMALIAMMRG